jgi:hypothetical protein
MKGNLRGTSDDSDLWLESLGLPDQDVFRLVPSGRQKIIVTLRDLQ